MVLYLVFVGIGIYMVWLVAGIGIYMVLYLVCCRYLYIYGPMSGCFRYWYIYGPIPECFSGFGISMVCGIYYFQGLCCLFQV